MEAGRLGTLFPFLIRFSSLIGAYLRRPPPPPPPPLMLEEPRELLDRALLPLKLPAPPLKALEFRELPPLGTLRLPTRSPPPPPPRSPPPPPRFDPAASRPPSRFPPALRSETPACCRPPASLRSRLPAWP